MSSLAESEKLALLRIARRSFTAAVERRPSMEEAPDETAADIRSLSQPGGAFVTIFRKGRLRGCIGRLASQSGLTDLVTHCARAVASDDPRFPRVEPEELPLVEIELSVLSEPADISPEEIEPGKHGLLVTRGSHRGVLLPQVAVQFHWNGMRFLEATCEKAGLARDAWKSPETRVQAFTAEVFSEMESKA
jgi:AmmeMemoRadiSam system protein A